MELQEVYDQKISIDSIKTNFDYIMFHKKHPGIDFDTRDPKSIKLLLTDENGDEILYIKKYNCYDSSNLSPKFVCNMFYDLLDYLSEDYNVLSNDERNLLIDIIKFYDYDRFTVIKYATSDYSYVLLIKIYSNDIERAGIRLPLTQLSDSHMILFSGLLVDKEYTSDELGFNLIKEDE